MKRVVVISVLLGLLTLTAGCKGKQRGPAYGQEQEFRKQIAESVPVKEWGYSVSDVRVSEDGEKVLVVFALPGGTNGFNETVLAHDGFKRYKGPVYDQQRQDAAYREDTADREAWMREHLAADEVYRSNMMASIKSGQPIPPRPPPTNRLTPTFAAKMSRFQVGSTHIVVTLPNR